MKIYSFKLIYKKLSAYLLEEAPIWIPKITYTGIAIISNTNTTVVSGSIFSLAIYETNEMIR